MKSFNYPEVSDSKLSSCISNHESFVLKAANVAYMMQACSKAETLVEQAGMTCRVYTEYRALSVLLQPWLLAGIAAHNLATYNPDYEIGRNVVTFEVTVSYKK